jgi:dienelactone hydrolase
MAWFGGCRHDMGVVGMAYAVAMAWLTGCRASHVSEVVAIAWHGGCRHDSEVFGIAWHGGCCHGMVYDVAMTWRIGCRHGMARRLSVSHGSEVAGMA